MPDQYVRFENSHGYVWICRFRVIRRTKAGAWLDVWGEEKFVLDGDGKRYAYRLTEKGIKVALLFVLFHKQLCGPLANSLFHHQTATAPRPNSKLEKAFHKADLSIKSIIQLLEAA